MNYKEGVKNYFLNVLVALVLLSLRSFAYNQFLDVQERLAVQSLKGEPVSSFFKVDSIKPISPSFSVGSYPSFWFDSTYYVSGPVKGVNVLICDGYRSLPSKANGFIEEDILNQTPAFPNNAFTFNGDLPTFTTSCILRSAITHCSATYPQVCKTQSTDSEQFKFE